MYFAYSSVMAVFTPRNALILSLSLSTVLVLAKIWAWWLSDSAGVLASAADSLADVVVSCSGLLAILYANRPADHDHRFGHGKMEGVAALFHAAFIIGAALFVMLEAGRSFLARDMLQMKGTAMAVMAGGIAVNFVLLVFQRMAMRHSQSLVLQADHTNYTADIVMHCAIFLALFLQWRTGLFWLDPLAAICVALWMMMAAKGIIAESLNLLLDRELPEEERRKIRQAIRSTSGVLGLHDLRSRSVGTHISLSFDIEVDPALSFSQAHDISKQVEAALLVLYPDAEVMIHVDPAGEISDSRHKVIKQHHVE